jgi:hypothetical protein
MVSNKAYINNVNRALRHELWHVHRPYASEK